MSTLGSDLQRIREVLAFMVPYKRAAILATVFVAATVLVDLIPPLLYRRLVDVALASHDLRILTSSALWIAVAIAASGCLQMFEEYYSCRFGLVMMNDTRNRIYKHLQSLPADFFLKRNNGMILNVFTTDILNVQKLAARTLPSVATNFLMGVFAIVLMAALNWRLTLITLAIIPLYVWFALKLSTRISALVADASARSDVLVSTVLDDFQFEGHLFGRLFGIQPQRRSAFEHLTGLVQAIRLKLSLWARANNVAVDSVQLLSIVLIYYIGGTYIFAGQLTLGTIIAFTAIAGRLYKPIVFFSTSVIDLPTALVSLTRITDFLRTVPCSTSRPVFPVAVPAARAHTARALIEFKNVQFNYPTSEGQAPVLRGMTFRVQRGERVAIVGPNGCGKTTIAMLLAAIYRPDGGEIYIDGSPLSALTQSEVARQVSVSLAHNFFFNASVRENLKIVKPSATDAELATVLSIADCHSFLCDLPGGIDTVIGHAGFQLSSGQKQRLALARLLLKSTPIMVLDESIANIDVKSEETILGALRHASPGNTLILITHNARSLRYVDRIIVVQQGSVIQDGSHDDLYKSCDSYRRLFHAAEDVATCAR